jgi:hypothetical protein
MSREHLLLKYQNLESKVYKLYDNKTIEPRQVFEILDQIQNIIYWTQKLDDNNQVWCQELEIQFSDCLEKYFQLKECCF